MIDRILQVIDYYGINKNVFYKETGLSNGFLDKVKDIGVSKLNLILKTYPDLNPNWLINGEGKMLLTEGVVYNEINDKAVQERVRSLCRSEGITIAAFERSISASNGYVNSISKSIGLDKLLKILEVYPNVDVNWLITGEGSMYKTDLINEPGFVYHPSDLESLYNEQEIETFVNSNGNKFYIYADNTIKIEVPIMNEPAYAGYIETLTDGGVVNLSELPKTTFKVDRIGKGNYLAFVTKNNSMWNGGGLDTPSGAEVLGREIGKHLWSNGFRRTDYGFILLTNKGIYHKDVKNYDPERGVLLLESRNPEEKDFELPITEVNKVFNVIKRAF